MELAVKLSRSIYIYLTMKESQTLQHGNYTWDVISSRMLLSKHKKTVQDLLNIEKKESLE